MANLVRRENREVGRQEGIEQRWDPLRAMDALLRWDPFHWDTALPGRGGEFIPRFDIKDTRAAYVLAADLPGVKEDDLEVQVNGNLLTVSGKREEEQREEGDRFHAIERSYGIFTRSFTLPEGIDPDAISADLKAGVLTVQIPKQPGAQSKRISLGGKQQPPPAQPAGAAGQGPGKPRA